MDWQPIEKKVPPYTDVLGLYGTKVRVVHYSRVLGEWRSEYGHALLPPDLWMMPPSPPDAEVSP